MQWKAVNGEAVLAAAVLCGCLLFSFVVVPLGVDTSYVEERDLGPRFILDLASAGIALAALSCLLRIGLAGLRQGARPAGRGGRAAADAATADAGRSGADGTAGEEKAGARRVLLVLAAIGIYAFLLIDLIGFYVASVLTLWLVTWLLGERRLLLVTVYALLLTGGIFALFEIVLQTRLPKGWVLQGLGLS
ncbi:MAG: tripartite tricarboxylate transporter TctB family protein [Sneathiellaceae bacterium]